MAAGPVLGEGPGEGDPAFPRQNIETWIKDKSEVEVVDLVLKLREKLVRCLRALPSLASQTWRSPAPDHRCPCRCGHRATSSL